MKIILLISISMFLLGLDICMASEFHEEAKGFRANYAGLRPNANYACLTTDTADETTGKIVKINPEDQQYYTLNLLDNGKVKVGFFVYSFIGSDKGKDNYRYYYEKPKLKGGYIDFGIGRIERIEKHDIRPMVFYYYNQFDELELTDFGICAEKWTPDQAKK